MDRSAATQAPGAVDARAVWVADRSFLDISGGVIVLLLGGSVAASYFFPPQPKSGSDKDDQPPAK
jgi:hypothetical protein